MRDNTRLLYFIMGVGTIVHYVGSLMLFVAMVLTIVVDITSPTVRNLSFVNLDLQGENDATFGAFGYCWKGGDNNREYVHSPMILAEPNTVLPW